MVLCLDAANIKSYTSGQTTWLDISGRKNNATLVNGPTFSDSNSGSIVFDGINDRIDITANSDFNFGTNDMGVECWLKWDGTYITSGGVSMRTIFNLPSSMLSLESGRGIVLGSVGGSASGNHPTANQWSHIVATRRSGTIRIYINGVMTVSGSQITAMGSSVDNPTFGIDSTNTFFWLGNIATFRVYKGRGLFEQEVKQHFESQKGRYGL
jgi:hypothetical protein